MSSASSAITYTSVYTNSEPGRVFWGADEEISDGGSPRVIVYGYDGLPMQPVAPPSSDYIPGPEDPQTPPVPQEEDELEEQPLPPVDSPTAESPGYVTKPDPEDDDDDDSSRDDADDEDEDEEEEEEHPTPADSAVVIPTIKPDSPPRGTKPVIPPPSTDISTTGARITVRLQASISLPPEAEVERLLAMPTPSPSPPISLSPPSTGERLARCTAPPALSSPPPVPSPLLPLSGCPTQIQTLRMASTQALVDAVTAALPSPPLPPLQPSLYIPPPVDRSRYKVGESSTARPTREVNTRVIELAELYERDTHDLYALLEDAQDVWIMEEDAYASREPWDHSIGLSQAVHHELQTHRDHVYMRLALRYSRLGWQSFEILTGDAELLALRGQQRARQPGPYARIPDHQDASGDANSHI
ncbi:hypothetical protein Tco_1493539 [Tanacetum coccineum]